MLETLALGDAACRDREVAGAKAARLALASAAGLPVPGSVVIPCAVSAPVIAAALGQAAGQGIHACRLAVMSAGREALGGLAGRVAPLGAALAVRSSSAAEDDPALAGAFTSLIGVRPDEAATAAASVWSSAIRGDGGPPGMGVLIQPEIEPDFAGSAEVLPGGAVQVVAADGPAGPLMAGWASGLTVTVAPSGEVTARSGAGGAGPRVLAAAAALARDVSAGLGDNLIEWAFAGGRLWLLQSGQMQPAGPQARAPWPVTGAGQPAAPRFPLAAARYAGDFGERWLLPWAVAAREPDWRLPGARRDDGPGALWDQFRDLSAHLTGHAWDVPPASAGQVAAWLSAHPGGEQPPGTGPAAPRPPDPALARQGWSAARRLLAHLLSLRVVTSAAQFCALPADIGGLLAGGGAPVDPGQRAQRAALTWEPPLYAAVVAAGQRTGGTPAAPGMGCGPAVPVGDGAALAALEDGGLPPRPVIVATYPLPRYAPLLLGAAGLVTSAGSQAAHLVTVARSLAVPVVLGCGPLPAGLSPGSYVAVDGYSGQVSVLPAPGLPG